MSSTPKPRTPLTRRQYPELRPSGHYLMLLLRAAVADDGRGGPFLSIMRGQLADGSPIYHHTVQCSPVEWFSGQRLVMLSGDAALAYACEHEWESITDPVFSDLYELGQYAITLHDAPGWAGSYEQWMKAYMAPESMHKRLDRTPAYRSAARAMRWRLTEEWMSKTGK
jgi:hypothetical protein